MMFVWSIPQQQQPQKKNILNTTTKKKRKRSGANNNNNATTTTTRDNIFKFLCLCTLVLLFQASLLFFGHHGSLIPGQQLAGGDDAAPSTAGTTSWLTSAFRMPVDSFRMLLATTVSDDLLTIPTTISSLITATTTTTNSPYAYTFVLGGIDPTKPAYRGMLYSIYVAVYSLKVIHHSNADFVLFVQMTTATAAPPSSNDNQTTQQQQPVSYDLTLEEKRVLREMGIHLRYIDPEPNNQQGFVEITMNKFRILTLEEYRRVIFLDADVLVVNNLDYLFEASDPLATTTPVLKENFVLATIAEPSNAGFFMLTPHKGDYAKVQQIIANQKESYATSTTNNIAKFDLVKGWGHPIKPPDLWETTRHRGATAKGTKWTFYCAPSDQGFLYHWTKYVQRSVSNMIRDQIKNFGPAEGGTNGTTDVVVALEGGDVRLEQVLIAPLDHIVTSTTTRNNVLNYTLKSEWMDCKNKPQNHECHAPHRDYIHMVGDLKPWRRPVPTTEPAIMSTSETLRQITAASNIPLEAAQSEYHYWFYLLQQLNTKYNVGINFAKWNDEVATYKESPLGKQPHYYQKGCKGCVIQ